MMCGMPPQPMFLSEKDKKEYMAAREADERRWLILLACLLLTAAGAMLVGFTIFLIEVLL